MPIKNFLLKKCASSNELNPVFNINLNLREAKSCAEGLVDLKLHDTIRTQPYQDSMENNLELFYKNQDALKIDQNTISTKDAVTNEVFYINEEFLLQKGRNFTSKDIAWSWKKDCRMWLWKNNKEFKKTRSVATCAIRSMTVV